MNFQPLFTTAKVMTAIYRVASTALLLGYLVQRVSTGRRFRLQTRRSAIRGDYDHDRLDR